MQHWRLASYVSFSNQPSVPRLHLPPLQRWTPCLSHLPRYLTPPAFSTLFTRRCIRQDQEAMLHLGRPSPPPDTDLQRQSQCQTHTSSRTVSQAAMSTASPSYANADGENLQNPAKIQPTPQPFPIMPTLPVARL